MAAFENAVALGVDGLELDVRLSRDGVVVVHHDDTIERTTRLRGTVVDQTAEALAASGVPRLDDAAFVDDAIHLLRLFVFVLIDHQRIMPTCCLPQIFLPTIVVI